ncbi:MAG TPA: hypothetical protein VG096_24855 [Bryobacteraceae bacterium]|nr:hypothetical protein [Bryobacteraceae bacterium]
MSKSHLAVLTVALVATSAALAASASHFTTSLDGQNGWSGGIPCMVFANNNPGDEAVTTAAAQTGAQSWRYGHGYGSPGCGTAFSPQLPVSVGRPSSGAAGDIAVVKFAFKAVTPGDGSTQNVYLGAPRRDDRTGSHIYLDNTAGGVVLYMRSFEVTPPATVPDFVDKDIATVSATGWHTVKMVTQYHENVLLDVTTYTVDEGTPGQVTFQAIGWPHPWRQDTGPNGCGGPAGCPYTPGQSLKFADSSYNNPSDNGYYYDNVSLEVINSTTNRTVGFYGTGFELSENVKR